MFTFLGKRISWTAVLMSVSVLIGGVVTAPSASARDVDCISVSLAGADLSGSTYSLQLNNACSNISGTLYVNYIFSNGSSSITGQTTGFASVFSTSRLSFNISSVPAGTYNPDISLTVQGDYSSTRVFLPSYTKRASSDSTFRPITPSMPAPARRPTYPYCSQIAQPTPSGKQTSPNEATFTWNAIPTATEYRISTSYRDPNSGWGDWGPWTSVGTALSTKIPIAAGQTVAFNVLAWCTIDSTQGFSTGTAYVDQRSVSYTAPTVPAGWICRNAQTPTITCQRTQMFRKADSKNAAKVIREYLDEQLPIVTASAGSPVKPPEVKARRDARKRLIIDVIVDLQQRTSPYSDGRFVPRS